MNVLRPMYTIMPGEQVIFNNRPFTVSGFNTKTLSFILVTPQGETVEAYHRLVSKINGNTGCLPGQN